MSGTLFLAMTRRTRRIPIDEEPVNCHSTALAVTGPECHDNLDVDVCGTSVQHHAVAVGDRTRRSARAAAKLERERDGVVQHVRSDSHQFHAGEPCRGVVCRKMGKILVLDDARAPVERLRATAPPFVKPSKTTLQANKQLL